MAPKAPRAPLAERVVNYPACAPQTSTALVAASYEDLKSLPASPEEIDAVLEHRRDIVDAIQSNEKRSITSPEVVLDLLGAGLIRPLARRWLTLVLNDKRERRLVPHPSSKTDMTYQTVVTKWVPTPDRLREEAPLPTGGAYLCIYGGSPEILSVSTVAQEISTLRSELHVADMLFWHLESGEKPALYSLVKGQGDRGGDVVSFPDLNLLAKARTVA